MTTRHIYVTLQFFAVAFAAALAVALLAPVNGIRLLGLMAMVFAACGFALQFYELHTRDPHGLTVLRYRIYAPFEWINVTAHRLFARLTHTADHAASHPAQ